MGIQRRAGSRIRRVPSRDKVQKARDLCGWSLDRSWTPSEHVPHSDCLRCLDRPVGMYRWCCGRPSRPRIARLLLCVCIRALTFSMYQHPAGWHDSRRYSIPSSLASLCHLQLAGSDQLQLRHARGRNYQRYGSFRHFDGCAKC